MPAFPQRTILQFLQGFLLASLLLTSGCMSVATVALETMDENISVLRNENCKAAHLLFAKAYCQPRSRPADEAPLYCFRTLGDVNCHNVPDPYQMAKGSRGVMPQPLDSTLLKMPEGPPPNLPPSDLGIEPVLTSQDLRPGHRSHSISAK